MNKLKKIDFTNKRGMTLEKGINEANGFYLNKDIAVIHKKPTPIQVVHVRYPSRSRALIDEAYYRTPSTTDYNGIYRGKYVDFEAKETILKTSFPLKNIHFHQIEHLRNILKHDGIAFVIVSFILLNEIYLICADIIIDYWDIGKKSIPVGVIREKGHLIQGSLIPKIDYLKIIDRLYF